MVRLEGEALLRLLEVRRVLETATVRRAAQIANPAQRADISRLCDALLAVVDAGQPYRAADAAFHGAICDATGNPMFRQILSGLDVAFERAADSPFARNAFGLRSFPPHRDLANAVVRGDADAAEAAINVIIDRVGEEIGQIIAPEPVAPQA